MSLRGWLTVPVRGARQLRINGPVAVVATAVIGLWLATGVGAGQVAVFLAYHATFVVVPGWLLYRLLCPADGFRLRQLVIGWALGFVLELLCFAATAALGARNLLIAYPLVVFAVAGLLWRRRVSSVASTEKVSLPTGWGWAAAGLCLLALGYLGVQYFGANPLPGQVSRAGYGVDTVWYLSLAGEALHHWPMADPTVAGQPLHYQWFSSFDAASISQVTGLGMDVVFFRLYIVPIVLLGVLGVCLAGLAFAGPWTGPIAAGLLLFVGELNLDPYAAYKFANELGDDFFSISPSFSLGLAFLAPAVALLCRLAAQARPRRMPYGSLAVFALLVIGAAGTKAPILAVIAGGLALFLIWHGLNRRHLHRPLLLALAITGAVCVGFWLVAYRGVGSDQLTLQPPGTVLQMAVTGFFGYHLSPHGALAVGLWIGLSILGLVGAYGAQLAGVAESLRGRPGNAGALLLALLVAGILPFLLLTHPGFSQVFFSEYGLLAGCLLSAEGLRRMWLHSPHKRSVVWFGAACVAVTIVLAFLLPKLLGVRVDVNRTFYLYVDLALAGAIALCCLPLLTGWLGSHRWRLAAAMAILAVGLTGRALTVATPAATKLLAGQSLATQTGVPLTGGLYRALSWVRTHSSPSAVIAVNNPSVVWYGWPVPNDFNYSAFAERPVFLEGWLYTQAATQLPDSLYYALYSGQKQVFPGRVSLNNAIFQSASADAVRLVARDYGVRYLVADLDVNRVNSRLGQIAPLVYANRDAAVYAVPQPGSLLAARGRP